MSTTKIRWILFLLTIAASNTGLAGESGQVIAATDLKQEPYIDAQSSGNLAANTAVEVLKRQGGWLQVKSPGGDGWVRMLSVKLSGATPAAAGSTGVKELVSAAQTGRSGSSGMTVATGIRGLSPEDLKNPTPNPEAVKKLDSFVVGKAEAENFARHENLTAKPVDYLQPAKTGSAPSSSAPSGPPPAGNTNLFGGLGR